MDYSIKFDSSEKNDISVCLPASKSISNRLLIIDALSSRKSRISNSAVCEDVNVMHEALKRFDRGDDCVIDVGASGTAMRFLTAYFSLQAGRTVTIDGTGRLRCRPLAELVIALRKLGAKIDFADAGNPGHLPLRICGRNLSSIRGGDLTTLSIEGNVSSQYISALMLIAPYVTGGIRLNVTGKTVSLPYIEMTGRLMSEFGTDAEIKRGESGLAINVPEKPYESRGYEVESDWSAASCWYEIKSLVPSMRIQLIGLRKNSLQGDSRVAEYFARFFGVSTRFTDTGAFLDSEPFRAEKLCLDLSGEPDLAPSIAVTSCMLDIPFEITGLETLAGKESDRIYALQSQLRNMGYAIDNIDNNTLSWNGQRTNHAGPIDIETFNDHRIAMSFAPAAIKHPGLTVKHAESVSKSYPLFWEHLESAGFKLEKV